MAGLELSCCCLEWNSRQLAELHELLQIYLLRKLPFQTGHGNVPNQITWAPQNVIAHAWLQNWTHGVQNVSPLCQEVQILTPFQGSIWSQADYFMGPDETVPDKTSGCPVPDVHHCTTPPLFRFFLCALVHLHQLLLIYSYPQTKSKMNKNTVNSLLDTRLYSPLKSMGLIYSPILSFPDPYCQCSYTKKLCTVSGGGLGSGRLWRK